MSDKEYFAVDAMSASMLKAGAVSMLYMQHRTETPIKPSAAMITGTLRHMAVLEPLEFGRHILYSGDKKGKEYKAAKEKYGAEHLLNDKVFQEHEKAAQMVRNNKDVQSLGLFAQGEPEKEVYWEEDGKKCKCKVDWFAPKHIIEFKTTANLEKFDFTAFDMNYHLQLGWYSRGAVSVDGKWRRVYVVVQESKPPYDVRVMKVSKADCVKWFYKGMSIYDRWLSGDRSGAYDGVDNFAVPGNKDDDSIKYVPEDQTMPF